MYENEEAKSCPFCGFVGVDICHGTTFRWRYAQCNACEARAGEVRIQTSGSGTREEWEQEARIQAIKEWNTRAEVNPWRYVGRDGTPETPGTYEVSAIFGDVRDRADMYWSGERWCWSEILSTVNEVSELVYAWHELPEPAPPLEPEEETGNA